MASITDVGDALRDPEAMLLEREGLALRTMHALIAIAESSKDDKARVSAAAELNKMLSLGMVNKGTAGRPAQINNNLRLSGGQADKATERLLGKFTSPVAVDRQADIDETLEAMEEDLDD